MSKKYNVTIEHQNTLEHAFKNGINLFVGAGFSTLAKDKEAIDKACFIIAGIDEKSLLQAVDTAVSLNRDGQHGIPVPDYIDENVSTKVVKIIQSYVGIVNKMVWRKEI